jgi:hypothetical protein
MALTGEWARPRSDLPAVRSLARHTGRLAERGVSIAVEYFRLTPAGIAVKARLESE